MIVNPMFGSSPAAPSATRPPWYAQAVVVLYLVVMVALGCRTLVLKDAQFGWGMFSRQINYTVRYEWVIDDSRTLRYRSGDELRRKNHYVKGRGGHRTRYEIGAVRRWIRSYLRFVYESRRFDGVVAIRAKLKYQVNLDDDSWTGEIITYPSDAKVPEAN